MSSFWQRSKRRVFALAAASAAGLGAAYLAYQWYYSSEDTTDDDNGASSSRTTDDGASTSGGHNNRPQEPPLLVNPQQGNSSSQDAEAHLQHHFNSIQEIAQSTTIPSLIPALSRALSAASDVDSLLEQLRIQSNLTAADKVAIWEQLKRDAFAELFAACWSLPLLTLLVKVKLNVLGRHLYLETALATKTSTHYPLQSHHAPPRLSAPSQEKFLSYAEHLAKVGHVELLEAARKAADIVIGPVTLTTVLDPCSLGEILSKGMAILESERWGDRVLPPPSEIRDSLTVKRPDDRAMLPGADTLLVDMTAVEGLISEVARIVSSQRFHDVVVVCAKHVTSAVAERLGTEIESAGGSIPLARIIPLMTGEARRVLTVAGSNVKELCGVEDVRKFCATVYSCGPPL